jgi:hypothetical protein
MNEKRVKLNCGTVIPWQLYYEMLGAGESLGVEWQKRKMQYF